MMGLRASRLWQRQLSAVEAFETMVKVKPSKKPKQKTKSEKKLIIKEDRRFPPLL